MFINNHYYQIGSGRTQNAFYSGHPGQASLVLFDNAFDSIDLSLTPWEPIEIELFKRAKQIEALGKPIRLLYSGGTDTWCVAQSLAKAGVKVDEYVMFGFTHFVRDHYDSEHTLDAKVQGLRLLLARHGMPEPNVTFKLIDETVMDKRWSNPYLLEQVVGYGGDPSFTFASPGELIDYFFEGDDSYTYVVGMEKPRLSVDEKGTFVQMHDAITMYSVPRTVPVEWFFISPDAPSLLKAQCVGVLRLARAMGPNLAKNLKRIQYDDSFYGHWCEALGRGAPEIVVANSIYLKLRGPDDDKTLQKYTHVSYYKDLKKEIYRNFEVYQEELLRLKDYTKPKPVFSNPWYVEKRL